MTVSSAPAVLTATDIQYDYGKNSVVQGVDLTLRQGEFVSLLGPSGCGKTTLLRLLAGLLTPQCGTIDLYGKTASENGGLNLPPEKRNMGLVFQDYALFPHMTVYENVAFGLHGMNADDCRDCVMDSLAMVGMEQYADSAPHALSGGQQQRVALARAVAPRPKIILMDEPFSGLDSRLRDSVRDETLAILRQSGAGTIMVTHDPTEAMYMSDTIYVMQNGQVEHHGTPADVYHNPPNAFVMNFMGDVNRFRGVIKQGRVQTPLGDFEYKTDFPLAHGQAVDVLFRLENTQFTCLEKSHQNTVNTEQGDGVIQFVHHLGSMSLVEIALHNGENIKVCVPKMVTCQVGELCHVGMTCPPHIFAVKK